jgi:hypothetical protein
MSIIDKRAIIDRFLKEYGEDYTLSPWIDPSEDIDNEGNPIEYNRDELLYERAVRLNLLISDKDHKRKNFILGQHC